MLFLSRAREFITIIQGEKCIQETVHVHLPLPLALALTRSDKAKQKKTERKVRERNTPIRGSEEATVQKQADSLNIKHSH